ncbi:MAG: hypothetical protein IT385_09345 [Deltaproteobacteria bacterium]|nr:hypothetical protein [Deltaproteobacteria bacterium]
MKVSRSERNARAATLVTQAEAERQAQATSAEELLTRARAVQGSITSGFWELGRILVELSERRAHTALGYERFDAMITERLGISKSVATRLMVVAGRLPRKEAVKLGQERAYALIAYAAASPGGEDPVALARADAEIVDGRPLSQTSVRELMAARPKRPRSLSQRAAEASDRRLAAAVKRRALAAGGRGARVEVVGDEVVVRLSRREATKWSAGD